MSSATPRSKTLRAHSFARKGSKHHENINRNCRCCRGGTFAGTAGFRATRRQNLGKVHFETSCKPEAQKLFDRGMLYQHSFWYRASQQEFEDVLKADPECGIAYWGIALSLLWNPHVPTPAKNLAEGAAHRQGQERRRQDAARARLHRRARVSSTPTSTGSTIAPYPGLRQGHGATCAALSGRRRSADLLRARAQHLGVAGR